MRRSIHGVELAVTGQLPAALLDELLGGFPEGDPGRAPHLVIELRPSAGPPGHGRPLFHHGPVQAAEIQGVVVLWDGASTARLAPDGSRIELEVNPASFAAPHVFEHVLTLAALVVALRHHGLFHLHAAALADAAGRALLVAGHAGSGKSTLAVALIEQGLDYLGDDAALLAMRVAGPAVLSFPRPFHVSEVTARAFPRLVRLLGERYASGGKRTLDPRHAFPGRERREAGAPRAILFPEVSGGPRTQIEPLAPAEALGALIESSAHLAVDSMPGVDAHLALLAAAVDGARCFRVRLGHDLLEEPREVTAAVLSVAGR
jgi:hypothetical protein